jgi:hypothetical protein
MRFLILLFVSLTAWADPGIYIDQIGDNNAITINQTNNNNSIIGFGLPKAQIQGSSNAITINQGDKGNTNSTNNTLKLNAFGTSNSLNLNQGADINGYSDGTDNGYNFLITQVNGNDNHVSASQRYSGIDTTGHYAEINLTGNMNYATLVQTGPTTKSATLTATGNNNTIDATQTGLGQHFLEVNLSGDGNSAVVNQSGATANSASISLINAGGPASVNLTQTGGQSYSITQMCVTVAGCSPVVVRQGP